MPKKYPFFELLKKYTDIDEDFIDTFFKEFKIGHELEFNINENNICDYLNITIKTLRMRLNNQYTNKDFYFEKVDYIKEKYGRGNSIRYILNYQCFERIAMSSKTLESELVRSYFIKLREFLFNNQDLIKQALDNYSELKKYSSMETIYFFAVDDRKDLIKIGQTSDIVNRLRVYNVGRINEIDLKYLALVKHAMLIEKCIKHLLKDKQLIKGKEIYNVEPNKLKKVIEICYCKNVSKKDNENLYDELSKLLGLYSYVKDKKNIKPYIIIGKNIIN